MPKKKKSKKSAAVKTVKKVKKKRFSKPKIQNKLEVGELLGIMYKRAGTQYMHKFTANRPILKVNTAGDQMYIEGGKYIWTPLGVK